MNTELKQQGASMPMTILFLAMASIILTIAFKLYPAFYENWQIKEIVHSFEDEANLESLSADAIETLFGKRLVTNNVNNFDQESHLTVQSDSEGVFVGVEYEVRVNIYNNIDAIVSFEESFEKSF